MRTCARDGHRERRGVLRRRRRRAARAAGRRGGAHRAGARARESYLDVERMLAAARATGRRRGPSRATASSRRTPTSRGACARRRADRSSARRPTAIRAHGHEARGQGDRAAAGVPVVPGYDGGDQDPTLLARVRAASASPCWSRPARAAAARACASCATRRGLADALAVAPGARPLAAVRRRHAAPRALRRAAAPRRDPDPRRPARQRGPPVRARVLDPAPPPEDHRGGAVARRSTPALRARMGAAAVALGTRDRLRRAPAPSSSSSTRAATFYFLEVNTRLQVEHPVTECVTGLDLVREQIRGRARRAARLHAGATSRMQRPRRSRRGCTPRTRRTASCPQSGRLARLPRARGLPGCASTRGVESGQRGRLHYDPMLAKVIAHGADRARGHRSACATRSTRLACRASPPTASSCSPVLRASRFVGGRARHALHRADTPAELSAAAGARLGAGRARGRPGRRAAASAHRLTPPLAVAPPDGGTWRAARNRSPHTGEPLAVAYDVAADGGVEAAVSGSPSGGGSSTCPTLASTWSSTAAAALPWSLDGRGPQRARRRMAEPARGAAPVRRPRWTPSAMARSPRCRAPSWWST